METIKCSEVGGVKSIYITKMPISKGSVNFLKEYNEDDAKEIKDNFGIECVILSPEVYGWVKQIKDKIREAEYAAEECFQELDNEIDGEKELAKALSLKETIAIITGRKPILNKD